MFGDVPLAMLSRGWRGMLSATAGLAVPLGGWWLPRLRRRDAIDRRHLGLAIVVPGIEGHGALSWNIIRGLQEGGFPGDVVLWDWTTGLWPLLLFHLRARKRNRRKSTALARYIAAYQDQHPGQPVYLVTHSAGAAIAAWALEALPEGRVVTAAAMLGAAVSPVFDLAPALRKVRNCLWHFWSPFDFPLLGAGALIFGTADGRHSIAAGFRGFSRPRGATDETETLYRGRLRQRRYEWRMVRHFHLGGHYGWANRVFVAEVIAPLLLHERTDVAGK